MRKTAILYPDLRVLIIRLLIGICKKEKRVVKELPVRKKIRLEGYDYSSSGAYFITICVKDRNEILARIVGDAHLGVPHTEIGDAHPGVPHTGIGDAHPGVPRTGIGDAHLGVPRAELNEIGKMVKQHIDNISSHYATVQIDKYVIMPNHIHMIVVITDGTPGCASPTKSTLAKTANAFKSLTSRRFGESMWQRGYWEHIIRNDEEYRRIWKYIDENPIKWMEDCFFVS